MILAQIRRAFENPGANTIRELESIVPHAEFLLAGNRLCPEEFFILTARLGKHHRTCGRYMDARRASTGALEVAEKTFEPGHPSIASSQSNLAMVIQDLGQMEEARDLLRKTYRASLDRFGPDHRRTRTIKSNLESRGRELSG